jgi:hypothetical protein
MKTLRHLILTLTNRITVPGLANYSVWEVGPMLKPLFFLPIR